MHPSVMAWLFSQRRDVVDLDVIEAGSLDENGSARFALAGPARSWLGTDMRIGRGVDLVIRAEHLGLLRRKWDVAVSTEMLEHAEDWRGALTGILGALRPGGLLILTCRGPGFPRHGYPDDHWRFTPEGLGSALDFLVGLESKPDLLQEDFPGVFLRGLLPDRPWSVGEAHPEPAPSA